MKAVLRALARALPLIADRRVLVLVATPLVAAVVLWLVAAIAFGAPLTHAVAGLIGRALATIGLGEEPGAVAKPAIFRRSPGRGAGARPAAR